MALAEYRARFERIDAAIVAWMSEHGLSFLRYSVAIVFFWFGALKIFGLSPADYIVTDTVFWFDPSWFIPVLGVWEIVIALCFVFPRYLRLGILLMLPQMLGTFLPFIMLPEVTLQQGNIFLPTMEGQYIIKNFVIMSAAIIIGSHVRDKMAKNK